LSKHFIWLYDRYEKKRPINLDLDFPRDLAKLTDPKKHYYLEYLADRRMIVDEVQRQPNLFPALGVLVDRESRPGRFLET